MSEYLNSGILRHSICKHIQVNKIIHIRKWIIQKINYTNLPVCLTAQMKATIHFTDITRDTWYHASIKSSRRFPKIGSSSSIWWEDIEMELLLSRSLCIFHFRHARNGNVRWLFWCGSFSCRSWVKIMYVIMYVTWVTFLAPKVQSIQQNSDSDVLVLCWRAKHQQYFIYIILVF